MNKNDSFRSIVLPQAVLKKLLIVTSQKEEFAYNHSLIVKPHSPIPIQRHSHVLPTGSLRSNNVGGRSLEAIINIKTGNSNRDWNWQELSWCAENINIFVTCYDLCKIHKMSSLTSI